LLGRKRSLLDLLVYIIISIILIRTLFHNVDQGNIFLVFVFFVVRYIVSTLIKCFILDIYPISKFIKRLYELNISVFDCNKSFIEKFNLS